MQSLVAKHLWAGETCGTSGQPGPPQHTIMHMVSIPGCIQLLVSMAQWQPQAAAEAPGTDSTTGNTAPHTHTHRQNDAGPSPGLALPVSGPDAAMVAAQIGGSSSSSTELQAPGTLQGGQVEAGVEAEAATAAPAWLVEAVCKGVEDFMRGSSIDAQQAGPGDLAGPSAVGPSGPSHARYTGPVLLDINGTRYKLEADAADPSAAWLLTESHITTTQQEPSPQQLPAPAHHHHQQLQASPSASLPVNQSAAAVPAPVPTSPVAAPFQPAAHTPLEPPQHNEHQQQPQHPQEQQQQPQQPQQQQQQEQASPVPPGECRASPEPAAARTFIRTVASGVAAMHTHGTTGLFAPPTPAAPSPPDTAAAAGNDPPTAAAAAADNSGSSSSNAAAVLQLSTSSGPAHILPPGMWAWPLYIATTQDAASTAAAASAAVAVCGSSAALPQLSLHGLSGATSCRVVLSAAGGAVLMDSRVPVEDGVVRWAATGNWSALGLDTVLPGATWAMQYMLSFWL